MSRAEAASEKDMTTTQSPARSASWVPLLEKLATELAVHGYQAHLKTPGGKLAYLHVQNPDAAALAENIYAVNGWFWWSWAERIAETADVAAAAAKIARVLRAVGAP